MYYVGIKDILDLIYIFLRFLCCFLPLFKLDVHRSKVAFIPGHGSGVTVICVLRHYEGTKR